MTIKYKKTLFSTLGLRENTQKTNMEVGGGPLPKAGLQTSWKKVYFSPKESRKVCLFVQPGAGLQSHGQAEVTLQNGGKEQVISTSGVDTQK